MGNRFASEGENFACYPRARARARLNCRMKLRKKQSAARLRSRRSRLSSQCLNGHLCRSGVPYQNVRAHCRPLPGVPVNTRKTTAADTDLEECGAFALERRFGLSPVRRGMR